MGQALPLSQNEISQASSKHYKHRWLSLFIFLCACLCTSTTRCYGQYANPTDLLKQAPNGNIEIDFEYVNQLYNMNRDSGIKNYLPQNITAKDSQGTVAQKFLAQATDQFVQAHRQEYATTVKAVESLNVQQTVGDSNFEYQAKILQGKAAMAYKGGYFLTTLSYNANKNNVQLELSRALEKKVKLSITQSADSQQNLSKVTLAYEF
jgi:hypothetical protein